MIVYAGFSPDDQVYIGFTTRGFKSRLIEHKSCAKRNAPGKLYASINKFGWDSFEWKVLCDVSSKDEGFDLEKCFISLFDSCSNGLNWTLGGRENKASYVTKKVIESAKAQARKNLSDENIVKKMRANSLTSEKQKARCEKWNEMRQKTLPEYKVIDRESGRVVGIFRGYKKVAKQLVLNPNSLRTALYRNKRLSKYNLEFVEV